MSSPDSNDNFVYIVAAFPCYYMKNNDQIRSEFCTCHDSHGMSKFVTWFDYQNQIYRKKNLHKILIISTHTLCEISPRIGTQFVVILLNKAI